MHCSLRYMHAPSTSDTGVADLRDGLGHSARFLAFHNFARVLSFREKKSLKKKLASVLSLQKSYAEKKSRASQEPAVRPASKDIVLSLQRNDFLTNFEAHGEPAELQPQKHPKKNSRASCPFIRENLWTIYKHARSPRNAGSTLTPRHTKKRWRLRPASKDLGVCVPPVRTSCRNTVMILAW